MTPINTNSGIVNFSSDEGEIKERENNLSMTAHASHAHSSNSSSVISAHLSSELNEFPKLQRIVTLTFESSIPDIHFLKGPYYHLSFDAHFLSLPNTKDCIKTSRWAGAILESGKFKYPIWGSKTYTGISVLMFKELDKKIALTMLSALIDIEDTFENLVPIPQLVNIIRGYCDWTDTGLERRQEEERMDES